jgi:two-component system NtrC family response regulator
VEKDLFRKDLLYRAQGFTNQHPPLRQRGEDIVLLARYFISIMPKARIKAPEFSDER